MYSKKRLEMFQSELNEYGTKTVIKRVRRNKFVMYFKGFNGKWYLFRELRDMFTFKHDGKMEGECSINTNSFMSASCSHFQNCDGSICQNCYSRQLLKVRANLNIKTYENTVNLSQRWLTYSEEEELKKLLEKKDIYEIRCEAFGEIQSHEHGLNLISLMDTLYNVYFVVWTKNLKTWNRVLDSTGKPSNMRLIYSNPYTDRPLNESIFNFKVFRYVDKIFQVFTADFALKFKIYINCGNKICKQCNQCYDEMNETVFVNEILKSDIDEFLKKGGVVF